MILSLPIHKCGVSLLFCGIVIFSIIMHMTYKEFLYLIRSLLKIYLESDTICYIMDKTKIHILQMPQITTCADVTLN